MSMILRKAPRGFDALFYDHQKEIGYQGDPNLYLDGVGTLPIEVFKREILFQLLEQQLYFPSLAVYVDESSTSMVMSLVSNDMTFDFFFAGST